MTGHVHARLLVRGRGAAAVRRRLELLALRGDGTATAVRGDSVAAVFDQALAAVPEAVEQQVEEARGFFEGEDGRESLSSAYNYATCLFELRRFEEAKVLMSKAMPIARRVIGDNDRLTLRIRWFYAMALHWSCDSTTLDDLRLAETTLEETARTARRVLGGANPTARHIGMSLREAQAALRAREGTPSPGSA